MRDYLLPTVDSWEEWGRIFTNASVWRPVVEQIWAENATLALVTGIPAPRRLTAGFPGTCAVWVIESPVARDAVVVKLFPPMVARDHRRELIVYRLLQGRVPGLPALLADGVFRDRIDWPYLVTACLPGDAWRDVRSRMKRANQWAIMAELGRAVRAVHTVPLADAGSWPSCSDWEMLWQRRAPKTATDLRERTLLREPLIDELEALTAGMDWSGARPVLLHADLTEDHLLAAERDGRWSMTGLLDWADAEVGDPYYEWVALWFSICRRDAALFRAFMEGYDASLHLDVDRLLAFTLLHRFGANVLGETLTPDEQRGIGSVTALREVLFGRLANQPSAA